MSIVQIINFGKRVLLSYPRFDICITIALCHHLYNNFTLNLKDISKLLTLKLCTSNFITIQTFYAYLCHLRNHINRNTLGERLIKQNLYLHGTKKKEFKSISIVLFTIAKNICNLSCSLDVFSLFKKSVSVSVASILRKINKGNWFNFNASPEQNVSLLLCWFRSLQTPFIEDVDAFDIYVYSSKPQVMSLFVVIEMLRKCKVYCVENYLEALFMIAQAMTKTQGDSKPTLNPTVNVSNMNQTNSIVTLDENSTPVERLVHLLHYIKLNALSTHPVISSLSTKKIIELKEQSFTVHANSLFWAKQLIFVDTLIDGSCFENGTEIRQLVLKMDERLKALLVGEGDREKVVAGLKEIVAMHEEVKECKKEEEEEFSIEEVAIDSKEDDVNADETEVKGKLAVTDDTFQIQQPIAQENDTRSNYEIEQERICWPKPTQPSLLLLEWPSTNAIPSKSVYSSLPELTKTLANPIINEISLPTKGDELDSRTQLLSTPSLVSALSLPKIPTTTTNDTSANASISSIERLLSPAFTPASASQLGRPSSAGIPLKPVIDKKRIASASNTRPMLTFRQRTKSASSDEVSEGYGLPSVKESYTWLIETQKALLEVAQLVERESFHK